MDPSDNYQTTYDTKTKVVVFYSRILSIFRLLLCIIVFDPPCILFFYICTQMESTLSELHAGLHPFKAMPNVEELRDAMKGHGTGEL